MLEYNMWPSALYSDLTNRQELIFSKLSPDLQNSIFDSKIFLGGCGLSSQIATTLVRLGFVKFILVDFDRIELSNLNRQAYDYNDLGKNKTEVLSQKILSINPEAQIITHNTIITKINTESLLSDAPDVAILTMDYDRNFTDLVRMFIDRKCVTLLPLNLPFGCFVLDINENNIKWFENLHFKDEIGLIESLVKEGYKFPVYLVEGLSEVSSNSTIHNPQTVIGANIVSASIAMVIIKKLLKISTPDVSIIDIF